MTIKQYDRILLKDGRTGTVVEILEDNVEFIVDVNLPGPTWETIEISFSDIDKIIK